MSTPNLEALVRLSAGVRVFFVLKMLRGHWQMVLSPATQPSFTIVTPDRLYKPRRVPQEVLNTTVFFQGVARDVLDRLIKITYLLCVDNVL